MESTQRILRDEQENFIQTTEMGKLKESVVIFTENYLLKLLQHFYGNFLRWTQRDYTRMAF